MLIEPADLPPGVIAGQVVRHWRLEVQEVRYAPVGFGSHHWRVHGPDNQHWFATVDDLRIGDRTRETLTGALATSARLRHAGLDFIVAPLERIDGALTTELPPHYVLAVYPFVHGRPSTFGRYESHEQRRRVVERLAAIHQATDLVREIAPIDDLAIPKRWDLEAALEATQAPWDSGPFGANAQALLAEHAASLLTALARYDELAAHISATTDHWAITHGEPHRGNTIVNEEGAHLIDWETARIAPPERDLWMLIDEDSQSRTDYREFAGRELDDSALMLYRSWWSLCEVSLYTHVLRNDHLDTAETRIAWRELREHLAKAMAP